MSRTLTVGVVGCGYWGPNLARNFRFLPNCRLKVLCDVNAERLRHMRTLYPEVATTTRFEDILEDQELDGVAIATAVRLHHQLAKACLLAGKHVLVEKPLALSSDECIDLIETARRVSRVLMVGHTFLYSPAVRKIKEIVDRGDIGEIRYIAARRLNLGLFQKDINVTWDLAPHDISILNYIMGGEPLSLNCRGTAHITPGVEDVTATVLHYPKDRSAMIQSSWLDPRKVREMTIVGSKRMIVYDDVTPQEKIKVFDARVERPPHYDTFAEFHYAYHYGDIYAPYVKQEEPLKIECAHFLECIETGHTPVTDGVVGLNVVRILEACTASLRSDGAPIGLQGSGAGPVNNFSAAGVG